jgi:hypothetical protein
MNKRTSQFETDYRKGRRFFTALSEEVFDDFERGDGDHALFKQSEYARRKGWSEDLTGAVFMTAAARAGRGSGRRSKIVAVRLNEGALSMTDRTVARIKTARDARQYVRRSRVHSAKPVLYLSSESNGHFLIAESLERLETVRVRESHRLNTTLENNLLSGELPLRLERLLIRQSAEQSALEAAESL